MAAAKTPQLELSLNCGRSEFLGHQKLFHFPPNTLVWWSCWVRTDPSWWISNNSIQHVQINFASGLYIYMYYILYTYICLHTYTHILRRKNPSPCFFGSAWAIPLNFSAERAMASLVIWFPDDPPRSTANCSSTKRLRVEWKREILVCSIVWPGLFQLLLFAVSQKMSFLEIGFLAGGGGDRWFEV